ncbi:MAG TPA: hypothetical protein DCG72_02125 [Gammaproteobacteria bacterium]|nr:hypothetical protein [Gammaproteobacteria bacterium]
MLKTIQLPIRSNRTKFSVEGAGRIVNGYIENLGQDASMPYGIYCMPGFSDFATLSGGGKVRAQLAIGGKLYVVADRSVYVVDTSGSATIIGGFPTDGPVYMGTNRREPQQIGIVSDGLYKVIDTSTDDVTDIDIVGLDPPQSLAVVDGYGILPGPGDKWHITTADDFTAVSLLDFASAESKPDRIIRVVEFNNEAWFFGAVSTETWRNTGGSFPFSRTNQFPIGCLAAGSVAIADDKLIWIADDRTVRISAGGYGGQEISNPGVVRSIEDDANQADITASSYSFQGHHFYTINGTGYSWQYDLKERVWSERTSKNLSRWRIDNVTEFAGNLVAGDYANGKLYTMAQSDLTEAGNPIDWIVQFPPVLAHPHGLTFDALYLNMLSGVGLNTTDSANLNPKIMIDWSDDGGQTWSEQRLNEVGKLGETQTTVEEFALGSLERANARTFRARMTADVRKGLFGATASIEALAA